MIAENNKHMPSKDEMLEMFSNVELRPLDIETTGLGKQKEHIIELGMVLMNCGKVVKEGDVKFGGGHSGPRALAVHGITDAEREGLPTFADRASLAKGIIENGAQNAAGEDIPVIFVGHNIDGFDIPWIIHKCREAGSPIITKDGHVWTVDTCKLSRKHLGSPDHKLATLCSHYNIVHGGHRALGDTYSCLNILCICMKKGKFRHVLDIATKKRI